MGYTTRRISYNTATVIEMKIEYNIKSERQRVKRSETSERSEGETERSESRMRAKRVIDF